MRARGRLALTGVVCGIALAVLASAPAGAQTVSCPLGGGGDLVDRGFYLQNYTAGSLGAVTLTYYTAGVAGSYTLTLTARDGAYDGPVLGTLTRTFNLTASGGVAATYDFGFIPVPAGHTVAFAQTLVSGPGTSVYFDTGTCGLGDPTCTTCPGVVETEGTTAPLDVFRRGSVGLTVAAGTVAAIPALGGIGRVIMLLVLLGAGVLALRRLAG